MAPQSKDFTLISDSFHKKPLPADPQTRSDIQHVLEHGYVILPDCFTKAEAKEARGEIVRLLGDSPSGGRNPFEGLNTNRIYSLLNKTRVFDKFVILPRVLALNDYFLDPGYLLSAFHTISINPGEQKQALHHDDGYIQVARPRPPYGAAIMVALSEYTAENGATRIIPGSHLWDSEKARQPNEEETIPALVPEGGVCYAVDPRKLDEIDPRIVDMMGYKEMKPFMGYVDALNPRFGAKRMISWLQKEVDYSPPTFARDHKL